VYALYTYACDKDIQSIFEEVTAYTIQVHSFYMYSLVIHKRTQKMCLKAS